MTRKAKQQKKDDEMRKVVREVNEIKTEMFEIKNLLKKVLDKDGRQISSSDKYNERPQTRV